MKRKALVIALSIMLVLSLVFMYFSKEQVKETAHNITQKVNIIIDPGHGGEDGGAEANDLVEKNINLQISYILYKLFLTNGFSVSLTRDGDYDLSDNLSTISERKTSDIHNRTKIANSKKINVLISIHQNKFPNSSCFGTQIWYSKNNPLSLSLADDIKNSVKTMLQPYNDRENKSADSNIYLINNATVPAILVECGFISNYEESIKLNSKEYQQQIAFCIYCGFLKYYSENY